MIQLISTQTGSIREQPKGAAIDKFYLTRLKVLDHVGSRKFNNLSISRINFNSKIVSFIQRYHFDSESRILDLKRSFSSGV